MSNLKFKEGCSPQTLEKLVKEKLNISDMSEIKSAMSSGSWPFQISPQELWADIQSQFEGQVSPFDLMNMFTKGEMPSISEDGENKKSFKQKMMEKYVKHKMDQMNKGN